MMYQQRSLPCAAAPLLASIGRRLVARFYYVYDAATFARTEREREIGNFLEFHEQKGDEVIGLNTRLIRFVGELKGT